MTSSIADKYIGKKPQDGEVVLSVEGVSKRFCRSLKRSLLYGVQDIASELMGSRRSSETLRKDEFWALKDVSFQLRRGESLGLVGANGAGKTTLLRIITGLIKPDAGRVRVKGRVAPLIALGAGFNPILTGRENIYVNMSILGLSTQEIEGRFQDVIDFAEIGDAIDAPVQTYSSGMAARLGFASAIYTEPDILLIDEVLAVGDIKFRMKCYRRLAELRKRGTSFILVSHNSQAILSICDSAAYLFKGTLIIAGEASNVMNKYEQNLFITAVTTSTKKTFIKQKNELESSGLDITYLCFRNEQGELIEFPLTGEPVHFCVGCKARKNIENINLAVAIADTGAENERVLFLRNNENTEAFIIDVGSFEIRLQMPYCGLKPGIYNMKLSLTEGNLNVLDAVESFAFTVKSNEIMSQCLFYQPRKLTVVKNENN